MPWIAPQHLSIASGFAALLEIEIAASVRNPNIGALLSAAGWDGASPISYRLTVRAGVVVGSLNTAVAGLDLSGLPSLSAGELIVEATAYVVGKGGSGGDNGGGLNAGGSPGQSGGPALKTNHPITIINNGTIGGGGGGGGGGNDAVSNADSPYGGVGAGDETSGGATLTAGGAGHSADGGTGGAGGNLGQPGGAGNKPGGAAGACAIGADFITWAVAGTRLGPFVA